MLGAYSGAGLNHLAHKEHSRYSPIRQYGNSKQQTHQPVIAYCPLNNK